MKPTLKSAVVSCIVSLTLSLLVSVPVYSMRFMFSPTLSGAFCSKTSNAIATMQLCSHFGKIY